MNKLLSLSALTKTASYSWVTTLRCSWKTSNMSAKQCCHVSQPWPIETFLQSFTHLKKDANWRYKIKSESHRWSWEGKVRVSWSEWGHFGKSHRLVLAIDTANLASLEAKNGCGRQFWVWCPEHRIIHVLKWQMMRLKKVNREALLTTIKMRMRWRMKKMKKLSMMRTRWSTAFMSSCWTSQRKWGSMVDNSMAIKRTVVNKWASICGTSS